MKRPKFDTILKRYDHTIQVICTHLSIADLVDATSGDRDAVLLFELCRRRGFQTERVAAVAVTDALHGNVVVLLALQPGQLRGKQSSKQNRNAYFRPADTTRI